jgi:hypothetical protein
MHTWNGPDLRLSGFQARVAKRRGEYKATIATGRKLLHVIHWMLVKHEQHHGQGFSPQR